ncbi:MAG: D-glucuronyl C5-epimerase family protein, partial [Bifidobacteriaceae bacterium]|nr:D-glucuronyl C5-epimerase family protein [Bifidobacteriaceae bacterium]
MAGRLGLRRFALLTLAGAVMAACAGFGYWVGKPGGLDLFGGPRPTAEPSPSASPSLAAPAEPSGEGGQTASDTPTPAPLPNPDTGAEPAIDPELGYRVSGHTPQAIDPPFITRDEVTDRTLELDANGALVYRLPETDEAVYQPVTTLQWAIGAHTQHWLTGDRLWLDLARASALKVLDGKVESDGAYYFPYLYEWANVEFDFDLQPPWYSGMAQGEALSVFTQMARAFPDEALWAEAASAAFES